MFFIGTNQFVNNKLTMLAWGYFQILFENALQGRLHIAQGGFSHVSRAKHEVLQQDSPDLKGKKV